MIVTLHVKTDKSLKEKAEILADKFGISLSTFINLTLRQALLNQKIVLDFSPEPNEETAKVLTSGQKNRKLSKDFSPKFSNIESAKKWMMK